ncbi:MAG TPA: hypothetical protein ENH82_10775 [bacterium]|nr:hypothetical protein [bacterium]
MPRIFQAEKRKGKLKLNCPAYYRAFEESLKEGSQWNIRITRRSKPKTPEQLGYYWAFLFPEIHAELVRIGTTTTIKCERLGIEREIPINEDEAHEIITAFCGNVGEDSEFLRMSEQDRYEDSKFITAVLDMAGMLGMKVDKLKAVKKQFASKEGEEATEGHF